MKILALVLLLPLAALSQVAVGLVTGTVTDPAGAYVNGAELTLNHQTTGQRHRTLSTNAGLFRLEHLRPGVYAFELSAPGFRTYRVEKVEVLPGQEVALTVRLELAGLQESVTVRDEIAEIERVASSGTRTAAFGEKEVAQLPMLGGTSGRNYRALAYQVPGVAFSKAVHAPLAVNGTRPVATSNVMVDSAEFNDVIAGNLVGRGTTEQPVSMEAVEAMEISTSNFKAEFGRASGAVMNLVTRRGGNAWHGAAYHFFQNSVLNARNPLLEERPPLRVNQPGVTAGGPIRKNRLFFFAAAEVSARDTYRSSSIVSTLTAAERARAVPAVRALAALYPEPNVGANLNSASIPTPNTSKYGLSRVDWNLSDRHRFSGRVNFANSIGGFRERLWAGNADSGNRLFSGVISLDSVLGTRVFNQFRTTYTHSASEVRPYYPSLGDPAINGQVGLLIVTGLPMAGQFRPPSVNKFHNTNFADDLSITTGAHTVKAGVIFRHLAPSTVSDRGFNGTLVFTSIAGFLAGQPISYSRSLGNSRLDLTGHEVGLYVQDDWRMRPNLILNAGVRYEYYSVPSDRHGKIGQLYGSDANNIAPRFGFAWTPRSGTVLRGGYGLFYTPIQMEFIGQSRFAPPLVTSFSRTRPSFPDLLAGATIGSDRNLLDSGLRQPYAQNWNLTVERQLWDPATLLSVAYVGNRGLALPRASRPNGGENLAAAQRPNPSIGILTYYSTSAQSNYHGLQTALRSTVRNRLTLRVTYTFSKAIDDISDTAQFPIDERNWRLDRALSDFHQPHLFTTSAVYRAPWFARNRYLGGWEFSGLLARRSGVPFSILSNTNNPGGTLNNRIDDIPGTLVRSPIGSDRLRLAPGVNVASLQPANRAGTLGRNTEASPRFFGVDVAAQKSLRISEHLVFELRGEAFNVFNTVNYDPPTNNIGNALFGRTLTANEARQMQLLARFRF